MIKIKDTAQMIIQWISGLFVYVMFVWVYGMLVYVQNLMYEWDWLALRCEELVSSNTYASDEFFFACTHKSNSPIYSIHFNGTVDSVSN